MPRRARIPERIIAKAPSLLPMLYRTSELAEILHTTRQLVVRWTKLGAPGSRDSRGHLWIPGREFAEWLVNQRPPKGKPHLDLVEGYCLRCRRAVEMLDATERDVGHMLMLTGTCPRCGAVVNRGMSRD